MNKELLKRAVEKATKNGFDDGGGFRLDFAIYHNCPESIIFDHEFCKAFWGEGYLCGSSGIKAWEEYLQKMVLEEQPLEYLAEFLEE